jgi:glutamyl-tRNA synthetase
MSAFPDNRQDSKHYGEFGRSPARFDQAKLDSLNGHYIRIAEDHRLVALVAERLEKDLGRSLSETERVRLERAMPELKLRPKTLVQLTANARFLVMPRPIRPDETAAKLLTEEARRLLGELAPRLEGVAWRADLLEERIREFAEAKAMKLGAVAQPLRGALTGSAASPGIFMVMEVLGHEETLARVAEAVGAPPKC